MRTILKRAIRSLIAPAPVFCLAIGFGAGALAMMPLGLRVSDQIASLMAAVVGSVAGIAGALALVHYQSLVRARDITEVIRSNLLQIFLSINSFQRRWPADKSGGVRSPLDWSRLGMSCGALLKWIDEFQAKMLPMKPSILTLPASMILSFSHIETNLQWIRGQAELTKKIADAEGSGAEKQPDYHKLLLGYMGIFKQTSSSLFAQYGLPSATNQTSEEFTGTDIGW
jgi:hypothetical protein